MFRSSKKGKLDNSHCSRARTARTCKKVCFFNSIHSVSCLINQGLQGFSKLQLTNNGDSITLSEESDIVVGRDLKEQYGSLEDLDISTDGVDIPLFLNSPGIDNTGVCYVI